MSIIKNITAFLTNAFKINNGIKMIENDKKIGIIESPESNFESSLRSAVKESHKPKIETLICPGSGLGIKKK